MISLKPQMLLLPQTYIYMYIVLRKYQQKYDNKNA